MQVVHKNPAPRMDSNMIINHYSYVYTPVCVQLSDWDLSEIVNEIKDFNICIIFGVDGSLQNPWNSHPLKIITS